MAEESPHLPLKVLHKELEARAFPRPAPLPTVQHSAATEMSMCPLLSKKKQDRYRIGETTKVIKTKGQELGRSVSDGGKRKIFKKD